QTDEAVFEDDSHSCPKCKSTNARLAGIDETLERPLKLTDEVETYKSGVPKEDKESIQFDRVHRVSGRRVSSGTPNSKPRPIIVKLSSFHDKEFIKSFIKNLTKGRNLGISDDFPKEVEEMRKKLYPVLKAANQEKRTAFFKEAEWSGEVVASHGTTHSKGVMVLFKPNLNVTINKTLADKNERYILAEKSIDETNI
ncbi:unnamed protein product, partial [Porites evermanni]